MALTLQPSLVLICDLGHERNGVLEGVQVRKRLDRRDRGAAGPSALPPPSLTSRSTGGLSRRALARDDEPEHPPRPVTGVLCPQCTCDSARSCERPAPGTGKDRSSPRRSAGAQFSPQKAGVGGSAPHSTPAGSNRQMTQITKSAITGRYALHGHGRRCGQGRRSRRRSSRPTRRLGSSRC